MSQIELQGSGQEEILRGGLLPIFIISFNRGAFLRKVVDSYLRLDRPIQIVVHDNGSDDLDTMGVLEKLQSEGCLIYRNAPINDADQLNNIDQTVQQFFATHQKPMRYVVTDCDVDLSLAKSDALDIYDELLNRFPNVRCVGPMLRIRDIPKDYPLYNRVMNRHIEQFWGLEPEWHDTTRGRVASIQCFIDTTFALHRAGEPFYRLKLARRVYYPYEARHLDWYATEGNYGEAYFHTSSDRISHWNNKIAFQKFKETTLKFDRFIYVDEASDGTLVMKTQLIPQSPHIANI
jgi:glycosyltransferase involved in cell wall biosynthesis